MLGSEATLAEVDGRKKDIVKSGENFKYSYIAGKYSKRRKCMDFGKEYSEMNLMLMAYQIYLHEYGNNGDIKAISVRWLVLVYSAHQSVANSRLHPLWSNLKCKCQALIRRHGCLQMIKL